MTILNDNCFHCRVIISERAKVRLDGCATSVGPAGGLDTRGVFLLAGDRGDILIFGLDIEPGPGCIASDFQADGLAVEFNRLDMTFKQRSRLQGLANTEGGGFLEDDRFTGALFFGGANHRQENAGAGFLHLNPLREDIQRPHLKEAIAGVANGLGGNVI